MAITIRSYQEADIDRLSSIHKAAFKGYMNSSMGKGYIKAFLKWFLTYQGTVTLMAQMDDTACGYIVGAPMGYDSVMNQALFNTALIGILTHPLVLFHKNFLAAVVIKLKMIVGLKHVNKAKDTLPGKGISLVGIAVDPACEGKGVGKQLMQQFEQQAIQKGMDYMCLSVYSSNQRAKSVYEKQGWALLQDNDGVMYYYKLLRGTHAA